MLRSITLNNFKCFKDQTRFEFDKFNLLTGANGAGKSSVVQPILVMRQSIDRNPSSADVFFNGSCVELGTFRQVTNADTSSTEHMLWKFGFSEKDAQIEIGYEFEADPGDLSARIVGITAAGVVNGQRIEIEKPGLIENLTTTIGALQWKHLLPLSPPILESAIDDLRLRSNFSQIHFISADRLGPQDHYRKESTKGFLNVGARGQNVGSVLWFRKEDAVLPGLCRGDPAVTTPNLPDQTEAWLKYLFGEARLEVKDTEANILLLNFGTTSAQHYFRPKNVGFGYSSALPIIVSCLIAKPGEILIVENPEAHLHPSAQSKLLELLFLVSQLGIQVFVETHSDHVLNSVRVAVTRKLLSEASTTIHYFVRSPDESVMNIALDSGGKPTSWPSGFFDQTDKDYFELYGM